MIIISSCKGFDNPDRFSEQDEAADLTIGAGGTVLAKQALLPSQVTQAVAGKSVLIIVHGYNNELGDALRAYSCIAQRISALPGSVGYDVVVGYAWPGGDKKHEYHPARRRSSAAGDRLVSWLPLLAGAAAVDIMTHSMGARVVLRGLSQGVPAGAVPIRSHFATASAVDNESIEYGERFYSATQEMTETWVFHSKRDPVLRYAYTIGDCDLALGLTGPEDPAMISRHSKNVKVVNCRKRIGAHGGYKRSAEFYQFIAKILAGGHPNSRQFFTL